MRFLLLLLLLAPVSALGQLQTNTPWQMRIYSTVADMVNRANPADVNKSVYVLGRNTPYDGGGGVFAYSSSSATTTNYGTVFKSGSTSGRWIREYSGIANVVWFGAIPDGSTDNTLAIQRAVDSDLDISFDPGKTIGNFNFASTINFNRNRNYFFTPVTRMFYTGTGTAFNVTAQEAQFTGLILEKQTRDFSDDSIGMLVTAFAHTQQHVNITKFTTGVKVEPTGSNIILENRWFVDISFAENHFWINATNIGGITSQTFYSPNITGTSRAESLYGFRLESTNNSPMTSCTWIGAVIEHCDRGLYIDAHGQGFTSVGGDLEDNNHHFYFGPQSEDRFWQMGGLFSGRDKPFYPESAENPDFQFRFLPSAHGQDYDTLFLDGGLFRGQKQGWWNLLKNSTFDQWVSSTVPTNWTVSGFGFGITNTSSGQFGPLSIKLHATGGDGYLNSVQGTNNLSHYLGRNMVAVAHVKASQAGMIRINVDDGITSHNGEEHSGSGDWEYIKEVFTLSTNATQYSTFLSMEDGSTNVIVDWMGLFAGDNFPDLLPAQSDVPGMLTVAADTETITLRPQRFGQPYGLAFYVQGNPTRQAFAGFKTGGGNDFTFETDVNQMLIAALNGTAVGPQGVNSVDASAELHVNSTRRGFLPPSMTTAQRDAINGGVIANGLIIYNNTTNRFQGYENGAWVDFSFHEPSDGDKGDISVSFDGSVWTIDNSVVTYAKIQNVTANRLLGRRITGAGPPEEIQIGSGLSMSGTTLSATGSGGTITAGSNIGTGVGVFAGPSGTTLTFNSLAGSGGITVVSNASTITIGTQTGLGVTNSGSALSANLAAGANITITPGTDGQLTIAATAGGGGSTNIYVNGAMVSDPNFQSSSGGAFNVSGTNVTITALTTANNAGTGIGVLSGITGSTNATLNSIAGSNGITASSNANTITLALTVTNHTTIALTSPLSAVSVMTNVAFWSPPFASTLKAVRFKLLWPSTSGNVTVDLYKNGSTVLTAPVNLGTGVTNATATLSVTAISADDVFTGAISAAGTAATNLQAQLLYTTP